MAIARFMPSMSFTEAALDEDFGQKIVFTINPAHADKILSGSGHNIREILAAADAGTPLPHFPISVHLGTKAAVEECRAGFAKRGGGFFRNRIRLSRMSTWCARRISIIWASPSPSTTTQSLTAR